ncbi:aromatic-ring-hydroxylating dioxygenase subunit beta [Sphingopyxis sp. GW247-27LB]|uniref:aromatic-ring-hydroxylating dioxygenase subunit beta n=1 Tax=Sphingopyxis sp. GW247-27LB TaxID=2012632 RepID=UPI000BA628EB|nr:aromatic-ring-hydroxylating dioxygenase subunit beta [Sphingopyxis sp. GW247-27LB]PAL21523.1 benzene 1,2-dioxygenase [Sphingopyxis sp. GW247-27LB]
MSGDLLADARALVLLEGWHLDNREWDEWLDLYTPDATYWLPCWLDEDRLTSDPQREMSLIYYGNRTGLEDRVYRIRTEQSLASIPMPRTCHMTNVVRAVEEDDGIRVDSNWLVHSYRLEVAHCFFGQQTHLLHKTDKGLKIASRRVILANDIIPNVLDIYSV